MTNALHLNIKFEDLDVLKQEALIAEILPKLQEEAEKEGNEFLTRVWNEPKPQTWQEAYCRIYAIEYQLWQEEVDAGRVVTPAFMWESYQEEHVSHMAQKKLEEAFIKLEIEVTL